MIRIYTIDVLYNSELKKHFVLYTPAGGNMCYYAVKNPNFLISKNLHYTKRNTYQPVNLNMLFYCLKKLHNPQGRDLVH